MVDFSDSYFAVPTLFIYLFIFIPDPSVINSMQHRCLNAFVGFFLAKCFICEKYVLYETTFICTSLQENIDFFLFFLLILTNLC